MFLEATVIVLLSCGRSSAYTMSAMLSGAIINIILDPIFIFVLKWGITDNYGAGRMDRVRETYKIVLRATLMVGIAATLRSSCMQME